MKATVKHSEACVCFILPPWGTVGGHFWWQVSFPSAQSIIFLREETAFILQNKQNKLYLKSGAHRSAEGMAQSGVSTGPIKDVTLTTDKWKSHWWPDSACMLLWKSGTFEWMQKKAQIHHQAFWTLEWLVKKKKIIITKGCFPEKGATRLGLEMENIFKLVYKLTAMLATLRSSLLRNSGVLI